jgi:hypothetical protein
MMSFPANRKPISSIKSLAPRIPLSSTLPAGWASRSSRHGSPMVFLPVQSVFSTTALVTDSTEVLLAIVTDIRMLSFRLQMS